MFHVSPLRPPQPFPPPHLSAAITLTHLSLRAALTLLKVPQVSLNDDEAKTVSSVPAVEVSEGLAPRPPVQMVLL